MQGPHQVAQKSISKGFPRNDSSETLLPSAACRVSAGAAVPAISFPPNEYVWLSNLVTSLAFSGRVSAKELSVSEDGSRLMTLKVWLVSYREGSSGMFGLPVLPLWVSSRRTRCVFLSI